ncbi:hypothetical protein COO60DRAFT_1503022 [Scenedesmus sp. NREL 46B-D3]|nr:hypothetical protein COO60DRAFT_1503022 [Scenedesmus sp. NREL 46B-D3]
MRCRSSHFPKFQAVLSLPPYLRLVLNVVITASAEDQRCPEPDIARKSQLPCTSVQMQLASRSAGLQQTTFRFFYGSYARSVSTLVVVEHKSGQLATPTLNTVSAALQLGGDVTALVGGSGVQAVAEQASKIPGVFKVLVADTPPLEHQLAEPYSQLLAALQQAQSYSHILVPSSTFGKNLLPRAAALLDVQPVADVVQMVDKRTFVRPIYAGNGMATVAVGPSQKLIMASMRPTAFPRAEGARQGAPAPVEAVPEGVLAAAAAPDTPNTTWLGLQEAKAERPDLGSARVVVAGGRALKSAEGFKQLETLADLLGGAVGASRAAVDAGFVPNDLQVGQTGKVVAPQLYIAVGISGAIQHVAGMKDSKVIVAVNSDADAPIFQLADYGLVGDLFKILPELEAAIRDVKAKSAAAA